MNYFIIYCVNCIMVPFARRLVRYKKTWQAFRRNRPLHNSHNILNNPFIRDNPVNMIYFPGTKPFPMLSI